VTPDHTDHPADAEQSGQTGQFPAEGQTAFDPENDPGTDAVGQPGTGAAGDPSAAAAPTEDAPAGPQVTAAAGASGPDGAAAEGTAAEAAGTANGEDGLLADLDASQARVAALTDDLKRLQAEYLNYKRRVDRDRELVKENATFSVLSALLPVLDDIDRARGHGELEGGFKAVADQLERVVTSAGLVRFGEPGDAFDPTFHEALSHLGSDAEVEVTTVKHVAKGGYRMGDRVVRAAQVLVVDPADA
jgi:molecular chaperone GrpE